MKPNFYAIDKVPPAEWDEGKELNFDTLQKRVYRRARMYIAAEAFESSDNVMMNVRFTIDPAILKSGKPDAELVAEIAPKVLSAVQEARECYVSWKSKKRRTTE